MGDTAAQAAAQATALAQFTSIFQNVLTNLGPAQQSRTPITSTVQATTFSGETEEDGDQFIDQFTALSQNNQWDEPRTCAEFLIRLRGPAYTWFKAHVKDVQPPPNRDEWIQSFKAKFGRDNEMRRTEASIQLQVFQQDTLTVDQYSRKFEDLALRYNPQMNNRDKILLYAKGLRDTLMCEVLKAQPQTYEAARQSAKLHESIEMQMHARKAAAVAKTLGNTGITGTIGHGSKVSTTAATDSCVLSAVAALSDKLNAMEKNMHSQNNKQQHPAGNRDGRRPSGPGHQGGYRQEGNWRGQSNFRGGWQGGQGNWQGRGNSGWQGQRDASWQNHNGNEWHSSNRGWQNPGPAPQNHGGPQQNGPPYQHLTWVNPRQSGAFCPLCNKYGHDEDSCPRFEVVPRAKREYPAGSNDQHRKVFVQATDAGAAAVPHFATGPNTQPVSHQVYMTLQDQQQQQPGN